MFGLSDGYSYMVEEMRHAGNALEFAVMALMNDVKPDTQKYNALNRLLENWQKARDINPYEVE